MASGGSGTGSAVPKESEKDWDPETRRVIRMAVDLRAPDGGGEGVLVRNFIVKLGSVGCRIGKGRVLIDEMSSLKKEEYLMFHGWNMTSKVAGQFKLFCDAVFLSIF